MTIQSTVISCQLVGPNPPGHRLFCFLLHNNNTIQEFSIIIGRSSSFPFCKKQLLGQVERGSQGTRRMITGWRKEKNNNNNGKKKRAIMNGDAVLPHGGLQSTDGGA